MITRQHSWKQYQDTMSKRASGRNWQPPRKNVLKNRAKSHNKVPKKFQYKEKGKKKPPTKQIISKADIFDWPTNKDARSLKDHVIMTAPMQKHTSIRFKENKKK